MPATDSAGNDSLTCGEKVALVTLVMCFVCLSAAVQQPKDQGAQTNSSSTDCTWMGWIWQRDQTVTETNPGTGRTSNSLTTYKRLTNTILCIQMFAHIIRQTLVWFSTFSFLPLCSFLSNLSPPLPRRQQARWTLTPWWRGRRQHFLHVGQLWSLKTISSRLSCRLLHP